MTKVYAIWDTESKKYYHGRSVWLDYPKLWDKRSGAACALRWQQKDQFDFQANQWTVTNHAPHARVIEVKVAVYEITHVDVTTATEVK
jgi:hypothetical protein